MKPGQKTISSYFAPSPETKPNAKSAPKRTKPESRSAAPTSSTPHVVDLTSDNDDEQPVRKKARKKAEPAKKAVVPFFLLDPTGPLAASNAQPLAGPSREGSLRHEPPPRTDQRKDGVQKYKYNALSAGDRDIEMEPADGNGANLDRRAKLRKLLDDNSIFSTTAGGRGLAPGKRRNRGSSPMDVDETYRPRQDPHDESEASASEEEARLPSSITSKAFATLTNTTISEKSKGKKKAKEEIGPSGEPYTPLEKQVCKLACLDYTSTERHSGQRAEGTLSRCLTHD